jgi:glycerate 2-kinase
MTMTTVALREMARSIFIQSLADCGVEQAFARLVHVRDDGRRLLIDGTEAIDLERVKRLRVVAVGKASAAMLRALLSRLKGLPHDVAGVLIAGEEPADLPAGFQFFAGGHPLPNEASQAGARAALEMLRGLRSEEGEAAGTLCLFLISGGGSAMMELPLDPSIALAEMRTFYQELIHSGASIAEINCIRKHFSAVKGGRLAVAAGEVATLSLLVSDVPPGNLDALASGPTLPDSSTVDQCREILTRYELLGRFPASVRRFFERHDLVETPKLGSFKSSAVTLLNSDQLAEVARVRAEGLGFHAVIDNTCDDWDYQAAAEYLVGRLRSLKNIYPRICLISSGEVTVKLLSVVSKPGPIGLGGRNQHFSLYAATLLEPSDTATVILSAGTDGIDGNSPAAGAMVDERTLRTDARYGDAAARKSLQEFDSYSVLARLGATIVTGATGNNLRDLRILLAAN